MVLAVVDDLLFSSKIRAAAAGSDRSIAFARRRDAVLPSMQEHHPDLVFFDLDRDALDPIGLITEIRARLEFSSVRLVGFASHVHVERLQAARRAGCDRTMARSAFVAALPALLESVAAQATAQGNPEI